MDDLIKVKRVTLTGGVTKVQFARKASQFVVKNFSNADCYVTFLDTVDESACIRIAAGMGQVVVTKESANAPTADYICLKGTGEVEVQQLNYSLR